MPDHDDQCTMTDKAMRSAILSSAEPPEFTPRSERYCYSCPSGALALETEGWKHRTCRPCWELAGEPGKEPAEPVLRGIREARAHGWR
jgi:hypothetical protein